MSILVTGGAGYIGSHMVWELLDAGHDVVVVDNLTTGHRSAVPQGHVELVVADVGDQTRMERVLRERRIRTVLHFAGSIVVPESITNPLLYYQNNTAASRALLDASIAAGVDAFVFSSTAAVYGMPDHGGPIDESVPPAPISPYGTSKLMTEIMLRDIANAHGLSYVALRYFNVAGADPKGRTGQSSPTATHLIKVAMQAALGQRSHLDVFGTDYATPDGTGIRDYIHVSDLVRAHADALTYLHAGGRSLVCNAGYGTGASVLDVISAVQRTAGRGFEVRKAARRPGDPAALIADASRLRSTTGWTPRWNNLDTIIAHAWAWERKSRSQTGTRLTPVERIGRPSIERAA